MSGGILGIFGGGAMSLTLWGGIILVVAGVILLVSFLRGKLGLGTVIKVGVGCLIAFALCFASSFVLNVYVGRGCAGALFASMV